MAQGFGVGQKVRNLYRLMAQDSGWVQFVQPSPYTSE